MYKITDRTFFRQDAKTLAKDLLGCLLVHETGGGAQTVRITETEAYMGTEDLASHSRGGRITGRNRIMFGDAGYVYMFLIYGLHHCFNITANEPGRHEAVLIRAGEPVSGVDRMRLNRRAGRGQGSLITHQIANGPGKLSRAMGLDQSHYGRDLTRDEEIYIARDGFDPSGAQIVTDARIGVDYASRDRDTPLRFYLKDAPSVSLTREQHGKQRKKQQKQ